MSNTIRNFSEDTIPYYLFLQQAVPTKTLRRLADCYIRGRNIKPLSRFECIGKIHQENLVIDIARSLENNTNDEIFSRGRILFIFLYNLHLNDFIERVLLNILPQDNSPLRATSSERLEFYIDRGEYIKNIDLGNKNALLMYERAFMYSYRGNNFWIIPLVKQGNPYIRIGGRNWIPFLVASSSLRIINFGISIRDALDYSSTSMRFTSYQPAGIALVGSNADINGLEIRLYGPSSITRRAKPFIYAFYAITRHSNQNNTNIELFTGYDLSSAMGPNKLAKMLYEHVRHRDGVVVLLRVKGFRYTIIAYGSIIGLGERVSAEEVVTHLLNYNTPEDFFDDISLKGEPLITYFSLKLPRSGIDINTLIRINNLGLVDKSIAINNSTYKYLGINTFNLSMFTYSSMSENRLREEVRNLLFDPIRIFETTLISRDVSAEA